MIPERRVNMKEPGKSRYAPNLLKIDQIDRETGEVLEGALVWQPKRQPHPYGDRFVVMQMDGLSRLMATPGIGLTEMRVFAELFKKLDFENFIMLPQTEIVALTGIEKANVSRAFKRLVEAGALMRGPKVGHSQTYRLSPEIGWRGKARNLRDALQVIEGGKKQQAQSAAWANAKIAVTAEADTDQPELPLFDPSPNM